MFSSPLHKAQLRNDYCCGNMNKKTKRLRGDKIQSDSLGNEWAECQGNGKNSSNESSSTSLIIISAWLRAYVVLNLVLYASFLEQNKHGLSWRIKVIFTSTPFLTTISLTLTAPPVTCACFIQIRHLFLNETSTTLEVSVLVDDLKIYNVHRKFWVLIES